MDNEVKQARRRERAALRDAERREAFHAMPGRLKRKYRSALESLPSREVDMNRSKKEKSIRSISSILTRSEHATDTLFFVFVGEWGYEILASHGWLRRLKAESPKITIGVASRAGAEVLYEDACDIYIDISDILSKYPSSQFGVDLSKEDLKLIEQRCCDAAPDRKIEFIYSNKSWDGFGIRYGYHRQHGPAGTIRDSNYLDLQFWKQLSLNKWNDERREIKEAFPGLFDSKYIVVQDRRRDSGWGKLSFDAQTWKAILDRLVKEGYKPVLIGYTPWKIKDATSIFSEETFQGIPGTINVSRFLTERLYRNLIYQAILFKNAEFWLGIWGSASMLPPLLGKKSYILSANRGLVQEQVRDAEAWKNAFSRCGGEIEYCNTSLELSSVLDALRKVHLINGRNETVESKPKSFAPLSVIKQNRVAVVTLSWNRLFYTQHCWGTLHEKAGMPFDHFVIDNGSTDGTVEWLKENEKMFRGIIYNSENLGIAVAFIQSLRFLEGYDWFIQGSNDVEILTDDFIVKMNEFWNLTQGKYLFAPKLYGIDHTIEVFGRYKIGDFDVEEVGPTGAVFMACSTPLFKEYVHNMKQWRANELCRVAGKKGVKNLYLPGLEANHYETTKGQQKRYPNMKVGYNCALGPIPPMDYAKSVSSQPFMTFITRTYKRPNALKICIESIEAQTDQDFEHIFIVDDIGQGMLWANCQFYTNRNRVRGKYVYLVDDDDYMIDKEFVSHVKSLSHRSLDVIMFKIYIRNELYPKPECWEKSPIYGKIGEECICVTNKVFQDHIHAFGEPRGGDFSFIKEIFDQKYSIYWDDRIVVQAAKSRGKPEIR